jgi:hypothetical protein
MGSLIRLIAIACSGLVLLAFAFFATDEMSGASQRQQDALHTEIHGEAADPAPIAPSSGAELDREQQNGVFRETIEDANDVLVGPFTGLVANSTDRWVTHGVPALLGVLLYGFGLGMLANMLPKGREHGEDWRVAA